MKFRKYGFRILTALLIFSLLIVGCTPARRPITDPTPRDTAITPNDTTTPGVIEDPDTENGIVRAPDTGNNTARNTTPMDSNNANTPGDTTGGARGDEDDILGRNNQGTDRTSDIITPGTTGTTGIGRTNGDANDAIETRITREAERVTGVRNAVTLVNNNVAYVGLDVGTTLGDEDADYVRDEVINRIHTAEPTINRVYVSSNPDTLGRLRGFGNDIRGGRPITGFIDQVETLFRRTIPRT
ncbi:YhcN/YlaJ family sporulation lipoprotein [Anaerosolibacter carboniphilus]|uniref:YhcN/YlaJ family sporulation lipoprotein n=1 Tax=Anaerosolibacter carboniphilus TaxID=1417629 RepID=A0A841KQ35_9FIRM|nr:YhcN/YlaJ family sporulation lipoprotein [Anaerosolibacter carboniphilus]MBB6215547.1 YhcN/YlaJ family sporulation lipoprotein [Anaerosolibacter carboniphilus]